MEGGLRPAQDPAKGPRIALSLTRNLYGNGRKTPSRNNSTSNSNRNASRARRRISRKASPHSSKSAPPSLGANDRGPTRTLRRLLVSGSDRRDWRRQAFWRSQPGVLDVRHRSRERKHRRNPE